MPPHFAAYTAIQFVTGKALPGLSEVVGFEGHFLGGAALAATSPLGDASRVSFRGRWPHALVVAAPHFCRASRVEGARAWYR